MKRKTGFLILIVTALVFLTSCISRENFFELANDTINFDMNIQFPGGGSIVSFGETPVFSSEERTITVENNGNVELVITGLSISGVSSNQFALDLSSMSSVVGIGGNTTFKIIFQPDGVSDHYATVIIKNNDPEDDTYEFPVFGQGGASSNTGPEIHVSIKTIAVLDTSGVLDFGNVRTNETSLPARFTIENTGDSNLTVFDISLNSTDQTDFFLDDSKTSYFVETGNSTTFDICFAPQIDGFKTSVLTITCNDPDPAGESYTFAVTGTGSSAGVADINVALENDSIGLLSISDLETFNFGTVYEGDTKTHRFVILNAGTSDLTINSVSPVDPTYFNIPPFSGTIFAGAEGYFEISFIPGAGPEEVVSTMIEIDTNGSDPDEDPYTFSVDGMRSNSRIPDITVRQIDLVDYDFIPGESGVYDFGPVDLLSLPVTRTFTVENTGGDNLTVSQPVFGMSGDFTVTDSSFISPILPGPSYAQTFDITFDTLEIGTSSAVITIANGDPDFASDGFSFTITGNAVTINEPEMDVFQGSTYFFNPNTLYHFGDISVGGSSGTVTFTIINNGTAELVIENMLLSRDIDDFPIDISGPYTIVPVSGSTTFDISFAPLSTGKKKASLTIINNDSSEGNFKIRFEGNGI